MTDRTDEVEGFDSVLKNFSDFKLDEARKKASALVQQDVDINATCSVLIASRQLYALSRFALHRQLTNEGYHWDDGVEELLIKAMADKAEKAFTRADTFKALETAVRKFMVDEMELEAEQERTDQMAEAKREDDMRTNKYIWSASASNNVAPKLQHWQQGTTIILVGSREAIQEYANKVMTDAVNVYDKTLDKDDPLYECVVHHWSEHLGGTDIMRNVDINPVRISFSRWGSIASSRTKMDDLCKWAMSVARGNRCDLLVVTDAAQAYNSPFTDSNTYCLTNVYGAIKALRRWAKDNKAVLIVGVPADAADWEVKSGTLVDELADEYKNVEGVQVIPVPLFGEASCAPQM